MGQFTPGVADSDDGLVLVGRLAKTLGFEPLPYSVTATRVDDVPTSIPTTMFLVIEKFFD